MCLLRFASVRARPAPTGKAEGERYVQHGDGRPGEAAMQSRYVGSIERPGIASIGVAGPRWEDWLWLLTALSTGECLLRTRRTGRAPWT